jgi:TRAP-type uncharacterized transport system substrate-binding protein
VKQLLLFLAFISFLQSDISIGTGGKTGLYYQLGSDIKLVCPDLEIEVVETGGSHDNLMQILEKKVDLAFFQVDTLFAHEILTFKEDDFLLNYNDPASKKKPDFENRVQAVLKIMNEYLYVITYKKRGITTFSDLNNKRIIVGERGSGSSYTAKFLQNFFNVGQWIDIEEEIGNRSLEKLESGEAYAIFIVGSKEHPFIKNLKNKFIVNTFPNYHIDEPFGKEVLDGKSLFYTNSILAVGQNTEKGHAVKKCISANIMKLKNPKEGFSPIWNTLDSQDRQTGWYNLP